MVAPAGVVLPRRRAAPVAVASPLLVVSGGIVCCCGARSVVVVVVHSALLYRCSRQNQLLRLFPSSLLLHLLAEGLSAGTRGPGNALAVIFLPSPRGGGPSNNSFFRRKTLSFPLSRLPQVLQLFASCGFPPPLPPPLPSSPPPVSRN